MPSPRSVLREIASKGLDPKKAHRLGARGELGATRPDADTEKSAEDVKVTEQVDFSKRPKVQPTKKKLEETKPAIEEKKDEEV